MPPTLPLLATRFASVVASTPAACASLTFHARGGRDVEPGPCVRMTARKCTVGAAVSASRTRGSYLKDKYHRLKARRGAMRAALAIAHKILVAAYHMLAAGID